MDSPEIALERLERDIAARLRPVCAEMNDDEFKQLVRDIAKVKLKYDPDPFPSDPSASASDESILPSSTTPEQDPPNERRR